MYKNKLKIKQEKKTDKEQVVINDLVTGCYLQKSSSHSFWQYLSTLHRLDWTVANYTGLYFVSVASSSDCIFRWKLKGLINKNLPWSPGGIIKQDFGLHTSERHSNKISPESETVRDFRPFSAILLLMTHFKIRFYHHTLISVCMNCTG